MKELEELKMIANDIFGVFEKHQNGQCTYDRALEDAGLLFKEHAEKRPIVGYVASGKIREILYKVFTNRELNQNDIKLIERILKS